MYKNLIFDVLRLSGGYSMKIICVLLDIHAVGCSRISVDMIKTTQDSFKAKRPHVTKTTGLLASLNATSVSSTASQVFCPHWRDAHLRQFCFLCYFKTVKFPAFI